MTEDILLEADLEVADAKVQRIFDQARVYRTEVKREMKEKINEKWKLPMFLFIFMNISYITSYQHIY